MSHLTCVSRLNYKYIITCSTLSVIYMSSSLKDILYEDIWYQLWRPRYDSQSHKKDISKVHTPFLQTQRTLVRPVYLLYQLLSATESMTDVTSSHFPSYHQTDVLASSCWIPALCQFGLWRWHYNLRLSMFFVLLFTVTWAAALNVSITQHPHWISASPGIIGNRWAFNQR